MSLFETQSSYETVLYIVTYILPVINACMICFFTTTWIFAVQWTFLHISDAVIPVNSLELSKVHNQELQSLDKTLKDAEAALSVSLTFFSFHIKEIDRKDVMG